MAVALLGVIRMIRSTAQGSMDAYYEKLALSLAREPIRIFRGLGFSWIQDVRSGKLETKDGPILQTMPIGEWFPIEKARHGLYPAEAGAFLRRIDVEGPLVKGSVRAFRVTATVVPVQNSKVDSWLSRNSVDFESLVFEQMP